MLSKATPADLERIKTHLQAAKLVLEGLDKTDFWILTDGENLTATAGLEMYEKNALLRSVAVVSSHRGLGIGQQIVQEVLAHASSLGIVEIILLTETARDFFTQLGFNQISRSQVPSQVTTSVEFQGACSESAFVMRYHQP